MLWICLLLPDLPLEIFTRGEAGTSAAPFAVASGGHDPHLIAVDARARQAGLASGQRVSAALALAPDLVLRERDLAQESAALAAVATWLTQFTPQVALAGAHAVLAEIGGSLRLFGGLRRLLRRLQEGVHALGYGAGLACAPTPLGALALARAGHPVPVTDRNALAIALAPLPLDCLDPAPEALATLHAAGIVTVEAACRLPRDALARRMGKPFVALLDRARGRVPDPQPTFVPPARYAGRLDLPVPVAEAEALAFAVNRLVHELAGWLLGRGLGVSAMTLTLAHERYTHVRTGIPATEVRFALAAPAREAPHLAAVLRERLVRVDLPATVESILLTSETTVPLAGRNLGLLPGDEASVTVPLLDRLRARLGEDAVWKLAPQAEHRPERAWRPEAPSADGTAKSPVKAKSPTAAKPSTHACAKSSTHAKSSLQASAKNSTHAKPSAQASAKSSAHALPLPAAPRPLWLLSEPQPLAATFEDTPWVLRDGPERIESGWWDGADLRRDYYVAQSPRGETLWIYRDSRYGDDGEWFLHGMFA